MELLAIFMAAALVSNVLVTSLFGLEAHLLASQKRIKPVFVLGILITIILVILVLVVYPINLLLTKFEITYLQTVVVLFTIFGLVFLIDYVVSKFKLTFLDLVKKFLPLILINSLLFGVALTIFTYESYINAIVFAFGSGIGYMFLTVVLTSINNRLEITNVPKVLKGLPINLITVGLMAIALVGLAGLF